MSSNDDRDEEEEEDQPSQPEEQGEEEGLREEERGGEPEEDEFALPWQGRSTSRIASTGSWVDPDVVMIHDGPEIRPPPKASKSAVDSGKKRKARWVMPKGDSKIQWKRLIEAVTMDYIQKGPDDPSPLPERQKVKKVPADDRAIKRLIKHRYEMIFKPVDGRRMTEIEIEGVMLFLMV